MAQSKHTLSICLLLYMGVPPSGIILYMGNTPLVFNCPLIDIAYYFKIIKKINASLSVSRWVVPNVFRFGAVDPVIEMVFDNERHILYARTEAMKLQVFELGQSEGVLKKVAEEKNFINQKDPNFGGRFGGSSKPSVVCISPISSLESKWLQLVAVLSDGKRIYFTTGDVGVNGRHQKPNCLKVVSVRPSPPLGVTSALSYGSIPLVGHTQSDDLSLKVETAYYSAGTLVLSDSSPPTSSSLIIVSKDYTAQSSPAGNIGTMARTNRALRESVSSLPVDGRMLFVADVLPLPDTAVMLQSLYSEVEIFGLGKSGESVEKASAKLWAIGDLSLQHIMPRRRVVVFSTMGMMELVFNRPVDILKRLLESNSPRGVLEDFFNRFGAGEAAAMCLMLASRIADYENFIGNIVADKAAEAYEDPRFVGMPQLEGNSGLSNTRTAIGGFSMGQVVQEAEPVFSGAHEGLCLCSARLLVPVWNFPVMVDKSGSNPSDDKGSDVIVCRLSGGAMEVLENKIRSLENFCRSRKNQRRGLYARVAGLGDLTGSILYSGSPSLGVRDRGLAGNLYGGYSLNFETADGVGSNKRQRLPYNPAELAAMEVRATECLRQLLLRSSEALFLLQLLSQHHVAHLVQSFDTNLKSKLTKMTFYELVCSEEGDMLATRLISALMEVMLALDKSW